MSHTTNGVQRGGAIRGGRGRGGGRGGAVKKAGPAPARHIPWPEIFRHHISLVEGHLKMVDMVRKHTVEGSGNHKTISSLVERARIMLREARATEREFVPPKDAWRNIPIGSSSDTMYPGYSPKDHQYGKAAEEFGKEWSEARKKGIEFNAGPDGPEYQFGQSKGAKRRRLSGEDTTKQDGAQGIHEQRVAKEAPESTAQSQAAGDNPLFFFDSNPTPVKDKSAPSNGMIAAATSATSESGSSAKRPRKSKDVAEPSVAQESASEKQEPTIEYDNIDREVDARLKLKEEAKKSKKDTKRKRESAASTAPLDAESGINAPQDKPAKKKSKSKKGKNGESSTVETNASDEPVDVEMPDALPQQDDGHEHNATVVPEKKKKKSKKDKKDRVAKGEISVAGESQAEEKKKSRKNKSKE